MAEEDSACDLPNIPHGGPRAWNMKTNRKGYRTYTITHRVAVERGVQGPGASLFAPGLPEPGSVWVEPDFVDPWAFFTQESDVVQVGGTASANFFDVTQYATNEPTDECAEEGKQDPLAINDRIEVESIEQRKEMIYDAEGYQVVNSAWEQFRGPQTEIDDNTIRVNIEQNVAHLELELLETLIRKVNNAPMWGFPVDAIRFTKYSSSPKYFTNCEKYWLRRLVFEIDKNLFVKALLDEATKVLHGRWDQLTGTGCTVTLTTTSGAITSATISTPGSGYPKSAIVPLKVTTGGTGGIILVETSSGGTVTGFIRVHKVGTGYSNGAAATTQRGKWVLLRFNSTGEVPSPYNPQHFIRPGDLHGQNTRFILDGLGMPIAEDEEAGTMIYYPYDEANLLLLGVPLSIDT